jgi:hypothetical protein
MTDGFRMQPIKEGTLNNLRGQSHSRNLDLKIFSSFSHQRPLIATLQHQY